MYKTSRDRGMNGLEMMTCRLMRIKSETEEDKDYEGFVLRGFTFFVNLF